MEGETSFICSFKAYGTEIFDQLKKNLSYIINYKIYNEMSRDFMGALYSLMTIIDKVMAVVLL